jgi:hypothetical protein
MGDEPSQLELVPRSMQVTFGTLRTKDCATYADLSAACARDPKVTKVQAMVPCIGICPALQHAWDEDRLIGASQSVIGKGALEGKISDYLLRVPEWTIKKGSNEPSLVTVPHNTRVRFHYEMDESALARWYDLVTQVKQDVAGCGSSAAQQGDLLSRLQRTRPWAFFIREVAGLAAKWSGLPPSMLIEDVALFTTAKLTCTSKADKTDRKEPKNKPKQAPYRVPLAGLEASLLMTLQDLERHGRIKGANNTFRAIMRSSTPTLKRPDTWRQRRKALGMDVSRLRESIHGHTFEPLFIPFPEDTFLLRTPVHDEAEVRRTCADIQKRWLAHPDILRRMLILAGGDPRRVRTDASVFEHIISYVEAHP